MRQWMWLMAGGLLFGQVSTAMAEDALYPTCTAKPTPAEQDAAQGAFKAGAGSYQEGDYQKAIMYWTDAYSRDCTAHPLLLNLAAAYERVGDKQKAIVSLQTYLQRVKKAPNRPLLEKRIANLQKQIEAEKPKPAPVAPKPSTQSHANGQPQNGSANPPASNGTTSETTNSVSSDDAGSSLAPWIVTGVGGAALIGGVVLFAIGSGNVSDSEAICPNHNDCSNPDAVDKGNTGRTELLAGGIGMGVGVAGVAGGLVWHFVFDKPETSAASQASTRSFAPTPVVTKGYAGLNFTGTF